MSIRRFGYVAAFLLAYLFVIWSCFTFNQDATATAKDTQESASQW